MHWSGVMSGSPACHPISCLTSPLGVTWWWAPCREDQHLNHLCIPNTEGMGWRKQSVREAVVALLPFFHITVEAEAAGATELRAQGRSTLLGDVRIQCPHILFFYCWKSLSTCCLIHKSRPLRFPKPVVELFHFVNEEAALKWEASSTEVKAKAWIPASRLFLTRCPCGFSILLFHLLICAASHSSPQVLRLLGLPSLSFPLHLSTLPSFLIKQWIKDEAIWKPGRQAECYRSMRYAQPPSGRRSDLVQVWFWKGGYWVQSTW